ncbi:MAG: nitrogenase component 1 [bacterium]
MKSQIFYQKLKGFLTSRWFFDKEILLSPRTTNQFCRITGIAKPRKIIWKKDKFFILYQSGYLTLREVPHSVKPRKNIRYNNYYLVYYSSSQLEKVAQNLLKIEPKNIGKILLAIFMDNYSLIKEHGRIFRNHRTKKSFYDKYFFYWGQKENSLLFMSQSIYKTRIGGVQSINPDINYFEVTHGDYECLNMSQHTENTNHISFIDVPQPAKDFKENKYSKSSVIWEDDIIFGGNKRIKEIAESITKKHNSPILIHSCCTPVLMGEELNFLKKINKKIVFNDVSKNESQDKFLNLYKPAENKDTQINAINLVGYPEGEEKHLLSLLKIPINERILPKINQDKINKASGSKTQVLFPNYAYQRIYEQVINKLPVNNISPMPPYGLNYTEIWAKAICQALNKKTSTKFNAYLKEKRKDLEKLKCRTNKYRVGLVLSKHDLSRVFDPTLNYMSIPLLELLYEMGFRLNVLVYCEPENYLSLRKRLHSKIGDDIEISYLYSKNRVEEWLENEVDVAYSDFYNDKRLLKKGVEQFSLSLGFNLGPSEFIRTIHRLLKLCESRFIKKYYLYMKNEITLSETPCHI